GRGRAGERVARGRRALPPVRLVAARAVTPHAPGRDRIVSGGGRSVSGGDPSVSTGGRSVSTGGRTAPAGGHAVSGRTGPNGVPNRPPRGGHGSVGSVPGMKYSV